MKMYSESEVRCIVEEFMARHFGFDSVSLKYDQVEKLAEICEHYGTEVENIQENK